MAAELARRVPRCFSRPRLPLLQCQAEWGSVISAELLQLFCAPSFLLVHQAGPRNSPPATLQRPRKQDLSRPFIWSFHSKMPALRRGSIGSEKDLRSARASGLPQPANRFTLTRGASATWTATACPRRRN